MPDNGGRTMKTGVMHLFKLAVVAVLLSGCSSSGYTHISQEKAMQIMREETGYLIVDVRRPDEFAEGHIAGAINVPNETIESETPELLPDKEQVLLVYCRTGRRSREAAGKLAGMGYTAVYDIGGIRTWKGGIEN
ncbi:MAG: rhodanese-like domain-containing protein [Mogibacterium sp.]|nr:rhodanese-like domain-containing protein [Mogibacterium sp.]